MEALFAKAELYPAGVELTSQASPRESVYLIRTGILKLTHTSADGSQMLVDLKFPGEMVYAQAAVLERPCFATAITAISSQLARCPVEEFRRRLERNSAFASHVNRLLCADIFKLYGRLSSIGLSDTRQRIEDFLVACSGRQPDDALSPSGKFSLALRQWELAEYLCVTPAYLSRLLRELEREGVIRRRKGWIHFSGPPPKPEPRAAVGSPWQKSFAD